MRLISIVIPLSFLFACGSDPDDNGSESTTLSTTQPSTTMPDDGSTSATSTGEAGSTGASNSGEDGSSSGESDGDSSASGDAESSSGAATTDSGGSESGTPVADCSECGPDQGCVAEVAFGTEYFCVPIPDSCGAEFTCACASEYCVEPFTVCHDVPDPPQRSIACECPNC